MGSSASSSRPSTSSGTRPPHNHAGDVTVMWAAQQRPKSSSGRVSVYHTSPDPQASPRAPPTQPVPEPPSHVAPAPPTQAAPENPAEAAPENPAQAAPDPAQTSQAAPAQHPQAAPVSAPPIQAAPPLLPPMHQQATPALQYPPAGGGDPAYPPPSSAYPPPAATVSLWRLPYPQQQVGFPQPLQHGQQLPHQQLLQQQLLQQQLRQQQQLPQQHPQQQQQLPHPPPIGFRMSSADVDGTVSMGKWDEDRDRIYMMVLSAEEFLGQMTETDGRISLFSQAEEKEMHRANIQDLLAIRGHLQDELLRIEEMLATDDPELEGLRQFASTNPMVVNKLWELKEKQKMLKAKKVQENLPQRPHATQQMLAKLANKVKSVAKSAVAMATHKDGKEGEEEKEGNKNGKLGDVEEGEESEEEFVEVFDINEDDLHKEHVKEEEEVAEKYTAKIIGNRSKVSQEELDRLLSDHALSMQALRDRQRDDKEKMSQLLQYKKQERLLKRRAAKQEETLAQTPSVSKQPTTSKTEKIVIMSSDSGIGEDKAKDEKTDNQKKEDDYDSDTDISVLISSITSRSQSAQSQSYEDDFEDGSEAETAEQENFKTTLEEDLWEKRRGQVSEEEFLSLIQNLRKDEEERKHIKSTERARHKEGIAAKLARKKKAQNELDKEKGSESEEEEDEEVTKACEDAASGFVRDITGRPITDEEYAELLRKHLEDTEKLRQQMQERKLRMQGKLDDKLKDRKKLEEIDQLLKEEDRTFEEKLLKQRHQLSDEELQALLKQHYMEKERLQRKLASDKENHADNVKAKLEERRRQRLQNKDKKLSNLDEVFFQELQGRQQRGELSKEEFAEMLQSYLTNINGVKGEQRKRRRAKLQKLKESDIRENVSNLVQQHQEDTKQLNDMRMRQKNIMDQRLKSKLEAKKNKKAQEKEET